MRKTPAMMEDRHPMYKSLHARLTARFAQQRATPLTFLQTKLRLHVQNILYNSHKSATIFAISEMHYTHEGWS